MTQKIREAEGILRTGSGEGFLPILPKEGEKNVLITSALPYCNNVPHLGNIIGSTLSADVYSRYSRARNRRTLYICGTDEYGTATEIQAWKEGITFQKLCDRYHQIHKETYEWFDIGFDYFGRTSTPLHTKIAQGVYLNIQNNGYLEKQDNEHTYCEGCQKFLADRFVEGTCPRCGFEDARGDTCDGCSRSLDAIELINPRCFVDKTHVITLRKSAHMYLKLDVIQPKIEEWIRESYKKGNWSANSIVDTEGEIVEGRLRTGLKPSPVTRDLEWGVPVPIEGEDIYGMKDKVLYVWFDAPIGYPSITANYLPEWEQWWFNPENVDLYQFMGKDNAYFHTVLFPSMQIADGRNWTKLHHLSATEHLHYEGGKFSKSKNRGVFGPEARDTGIPASVWRYYLLSIRPETADSVFSWSDCIAANNNVLLNNFGNFVNRVLKFTSSQYNSIVPDSGDAAAPLSPNDPDDADFISVVNGLLKDYIDAMDAVKLRLGLQIVMLISIRVILRAINLIYALSVLIYPFMPATSEAILKQLNAPARTVPQVLSIDILGGHTLGTPEHLFKKIDEGMAEIWRQKFGKSEAVTETTEKLVSGVKGKKKGPVKPAAVIAEILAEQCRPVRNLKVESADTEV